MMVRNLILDQVQDTEMIECLEDNDDDDQAEENQLEGY